MLRALDERLLNKKQQKAKLEGDQERWWFMKGLFILVFLATVLLAACENGASPGSLPQSEQDDVAAETAADSGVVRGEVNVDLLTQFPATATVPAAELESTENKRADANVLFVEATLRDDETWTFSVTVEHDDTGWEDYADGWDVVLPDGTIVKPDPDSPFTRLLLHPHENEQPFTRSQSGILIPAAVESVTVRAHDIVDGYGGKEVVVDLTAENGPDFEVSR